MQEQQIQQQQQKQRQQQQQQHNSTNMVKSLPIEESQLCDDILSCILALDEVIAEFDDSNSLSSPPPPLPPSSSLSLSTSVEPRASPESLISPSSPSSSSSPSSVVPIETTRPTNNNHTSCTNNNNNNNSLQTTVKLKPQQQQQQLQPGGSAIIPPSSESTSSSSFTEQSPHTNHVPQQKLHGRLLAPISSSETMTTTNIMASSQVQAEVKQDMMNKQWVTSSSSAAAALTEQQAEEEEVEEDGLNLRLATTDLREDLIRKSASPSGKCTKIPTLKTCTSSIMIGPSATATSGGGGGSFPKVKMRSCPNPLLEYRSVKMQNFVLPDELPAELMKENWCLSPGKNLPRSLARTRDTCITDDGDGQIPKYSNPRFIEAIKNNNEGKSSSRIPKRFQNNKNETNGGTSNNNHGSPPSNISSSSSIPVPKPRKSNSSSTSSSEKLTSPSKSSPVNLSAITVMSMSTSAENSPKLAMDVGTSSSPPTIPTQFYFKSSPQQKGGGGNKKSSRSNRMHKNRIEFGSPDRQKIIGQQNGNGHHHPHQQQHKLIPETDDGYLSMINRAEECPALWPEEMIENEIFSADELKRLSFTPNDNGSVVTEKTDYFSDDSLESESPGLTESFSSASNGKGTYSKPTTKVRMNAIDYFGTSSSSPPPPSSQPDPITVMSVENRTPVSFFVPLEISSPNNDNGKAMKRRKGKAKKQADILDFPNPPAAEVNQNCAKKTENIIITQDNDKIGRKLQEEQTNVVVSKRRRIRQEEENVGVKETEKKLDVNHHRVSVTINKKEENGQDGEENKRIIPIEKKQQHDDDVVVINSSENKVSVIVPNNNNNNIQGKEETFQPSETTTTTTRTDKLKSVDTKQQSQTPEKASMIMSLIEEFAEKLAAKIERSGSEEAAATLALNRVEIELQNLHCWTPNGANQGDEEVIVTMSNNNNNLNNCVPETIHQETDKKTAEKSQQYSPKSEHKNVEAASPEHVSCINIFIPGNDVKQQHQQEEVVVVKEAASAKDKESSSSPNQNINHRQKTSSLSPSSRKENAKAADASGSTEDLFFDSKETTAAPPPAHDNPMVVTTKKEEKKIKPPQRLSLTSDDNVDNTSDDLETPPEFIPEFPPTTEPIIPQTDYLDKIAQWNTTTVSSHDGQNNVHNSSSVSKKSKNASNKVKDNNRTANSFSRHSPPPTTNGTLSSSSREDLAACPKQFLERNSRSSEDLIQALNSHDSCRPSASMNRLGASTLPLNTRPPPSSAGGPLRPLRNMFNRFRRSKNKRSSMSLSEHSTTLERPNSRPVAMYLPHDEDIDEYEQSNNESMKHFSSNGSERKIINETTSGQSTANNNNKKPSFFMRMFSRKK